MGWTGAAIPEALGGAGLGHLGLCVLAEELGSALAPTPFSSSIYLAAEAIMLAGSEAQKQAWLPKLASGTIIGTLAMAEGPGKADPSKLRTTLRGGALTGEKLPVPDGDVADLAVVAARGDRGLQLALVELNGPGVSRHAVDTIDPTRSHARLIFDGAAAEPSANRAGARPCSRRVQERAAVLMAFEQVGGAQRSLEMARDYALGSAMPSVGRSARSRRSSTSLPTSTLPPSWRARTPTTAPGRSAATPPSCRWRRRRRAISANEAYYLAAKENIQMHGGMGFTWEFDCHLHYRRAKLLALALGSTRLWKERLLPARGGKCPVVSGGSMDFEDTPEETEFRAGVRAFLAKAAEPRAARHRHGLPGR